MELTIKTQYRGACTFPSCDTTQVVNGVASLGFDLTEVNLVHRGKGFPPDDLEALKTSLHAAIALETKLVKSSGTEPSLLLHLVLRSACLTPLNFKVVSSRLDRHTESGSNSSKAVERSENVVTMAAGSSVRALKEKLEHLGLSGGRRACTTRLTLGSTTQVTRNNKRATRTQLHGVRQRTMSENKALLGEYTGTSTSSTIPLLVLSEPAAVEDFAAEVLVRVVLPKGQKQQITLHVPPSASLVNVKAKLHEQFNLPPPDTFELFCGERRLPLPLNHATSSQDDTIDHHLAMAPPEPEASITTPATSTAPTKLLVQSGSGTLFTVADALRLLPAESLLPLAAESSPPAMSLTLLLLPSIPLDLAQIPVGTIRDSLASYQTASQQPVRITTYDQLNRAHPKSLRANANLSIPKESRAIRTSGAAAPLPLASSTPASLPSSITSLRGATSVAPPVEHRPSRPAAHPKERVSKARKAFAGLRRGNLSAPEEKEKRSEVQRRQRAPVDSPPASPLGPHSDNECITTTTNSTTNNNNNNADTSSGCKQTSLIDACAQACALWPLQIQDKR